MNIFEILLGQIPEALYFSLFMIFTKNLKEKRLLFTFLMILEYLFLAHIIGFNIWFQVSYIFITFLILKTLYKEKAQIIDIFTFMIGSIIMGLIDGILYYIVWKIWNNYLIYVIIVRSIQVVFFLIFHNKLYKIQNLYKLLWNRNKQHPNKIKSATFRSLNIVVFNLMFYFINIVIVFTLFQRGGA